MYITSMTHRDELFELTLRWMNDDFDPEDGKTATRIFLYESAISSVVVNRMREFLSTLFQTPLQTERIRQKHALREGIIHYLPRKSSRNMSLVESYRTNPEFYFPRLPIDAILMTTPDRKLVASGRIKQLNRIAEKVSFRVVDALFQEIKAEAKRIAGYRAAEADVSIAELESSPETMRRDFFEAEAKVSLGFKNKGVKIDSQSMILNDLLGFKIIAEPEMIDLIPVMLEKESGFALAEIEHHTGDYKAVNLLVDMELPEPEELISRLRGTDWSIALKRGLDPEEVRSNAGEYVEQGERWVRVEIILTTYDELMESEFGRSIHELRVLRLRQRQNYSGPLAQNAAYIVEYLLALASSPTVVLQELPVKMYGRYLPETIATSKWALYGYDVDSAIVNAFCPKLLCL